MPSSRLGNNATSTATITKGRMWLWQCGLVSMMVASVLWTCQQINDAYEKDSARYEFDEQTNRRLDYKPATSGGPFIVGFLSPYTTPIFVGTLLILAMPRPTAISQSGKSTMSSFRNRLYKRLGWQESNGDPNITLWTLLLVGLPCFFVAFSPAIFASHHTLLGRIDKLRKPTGVAAAMALSFFLIPVAKHSPLLRIFRLSFSQATAFHRACGWLSFGFAFWHGLHFTIYYGLKQTAEGASFGENVRANLIPPATCWSWDLLDYQYSSDDHPRTSTSTHGKKYKVLDCYHMWRNFSGVISGMAFFVLALTSLPRVRRQMFRVFYMVHIPMAWTMLIFAIAHFSFIIIFLLPTILYYFTFTIPIWMQQWITSNYYKVGARIHSATSILESNGCFLIRLTRPKGSPVGNSSMGGVFKLYLPSISGIWHPFSAFLDPSSPNGDYFMLIRTTGPFTKCLHEALLGKATSHNIEEAPSMESDSQSSSPVVLVDGMYPAEYRWLSSLNSHDSVLFVAGGVGIVPFLTLLPKLPTAFKTPTSKLRHVSLHWYCREPQLARYIWQRFLSKMVVEWNAESDGILRVSASQEDHTEDAKNSSIVPRVEIFIHITSWEAGADISNGFLDRQGAGLEDGQSQTPLAKTVVFDDIQKTPWKLAIWTPQSSMYKNLPLVVWYAGITVFCLFLHGWHSGIVPKHVIFPRTYSVGAILFFVLAWSLLMVCAWERYHRMFHSEAKNPKVLESHDSLLSTDTDQTDTLDSTVSSEREVSSPPPMAVTTNGLEDWIQLHSGRPILTDVIDSVVQADHPGAYFCGPRQLRDTIKHAITQERRTRLGWSGASCAIYDEQSEL